MIDPKNVMWVYSGLKGCACGCKGKYSVSPAHVAGAEEDKGSSVVPEDISQRSVNSIVAKFNARWPNVGCDGPFQYWFETETRLYMVRLATIEQKEAV